MPTQPESPPYYTPILQNGQDLVSVPWLRYFEQQGQEVASASRSQASTSLSTQGAAIGATPILVTSSTGLYRVTIYLRITRAASVSSSATVSIGWTDTGVAVTYTLPAVTGNTTTSFISETVMVRADGATGITYAVAYASVGGTSMQYSLDVVVEALS